jgi:Fic family protein
MAGLIDSSDLRRVRVRDTVIETTFGTTSFTPPSWTEVPKLLNEAVRHINERVTSDPLHAAAYALWRLNWIHPFAPDGNGRTSRAVAFWLLCVGYRRHIPGRPSFVELIARRKHDLYDALGAADRAWARGELDVSAMEAFLFDMLEEQIRGA